VKLSELRQILDESSFEALLHQEGRCITADRELLIVSSHDHRSAAQNKASCIKRVEEMMAKASWVEPSYTAVTESTLSPRLVTATKHKRWKDSAVRKARQQIRSGKF
jgi:hypothetical protein